MLINTISDWRQAMTAGTKVRTLYQHSETGTVCRPTKENLPMPGPEWFVVKYDRDGAKAVIHRNMLALAN